jgi:hypothetical protein
MSIRCVVDVRRLPALVGTLVASETFPGADGAAWPSQWTPIVALGAATQVGGKGRLQTDVGYKAFREVLAGVNLKNVEVYAEFTPRALTECYPEVSVRQLTTATGPYADGHFLNMYINPTAGAATFTMGGSITSTGSFNTATANVGTWTIESWALRLRAVESTVTAKVWKVSAGEATAVSQTITDANFDRSGGVALAYNSGNSTDPGVDWDNVKVYDLGNTTVTPVTPTDPVTTYSYDFTGTTGTTPAYVAIAQGVPPAYDVKYPQVQPTIQNNALTVTSGSTAAWSGGGSWFLGDPNVPQGSSSLPPIASNGTYTFNYSLLNLSEQYPAIGFRTRGADLWPGGSGQNQPRNGGYSLQLAPAGNNISLIQNYNSSVVANIPFTFPSKDLKFKITLNRKRLSFKIWAAAASEPTAWTYDADGVLYDESDGSLMFGIGNGPAAEQKTVTVDNLVWQTPVLSLGTNTTTAPTTEPSGFTRILTADFTTTAAAGTGSGQFLNVYSPVFQPYNDGGTVYDSNNPTTTGGASATSRMVSAHDGVMDVYSDGVYASGGSFGSPTNTYNRIGGAFTIRMKALGMFGNGPAFMIWPTNEAWVEGELDFPESVSGRGGPSGFQDAPFIHHHTMNTDHPADQRASQDVNLGVSWRDWHEYRLEWYPPGKGATPTTGNVRYLIDGVQIYNTTTDIPKTAHRWCYQIGDYGTPGNIYIDWYTIASLN